MTRYLPATAMLVAVGAQAAGSACDTVKATLAARIEATGVRGYALDAVPAGTPLPRDGKVVGTCEGGAVKIVYRRWGASEPPIAGAAPAASVAAVAAAPGPAPVKASPPPPLPSPAPPSPTPTPSPSPVVSEPSPAPAATTPIVVAAASEPALDKPAAADAGTSPSTTIADLAVTYWPWLAALVALPLAAWAWFWLAYRRFYDKAGLPRGPKLTR